MSQNNIDATEIDRFAKLSSQWWDADGKFKALHALTPARMRFIRETAHAHFPDLQPGLRPLTGKTVLDVGCGGGLASEPLARLGATVLGIDPAEENIEAARTHATQAGLTLTYAAQRAEDLVAESRTFDLVVSLEVIEHVPDPAAFVATCGALVAPGGVLVLSTLNRTARAYALAIVAGEYILGWLDRGTHDWNRFVTPDELARYLRAAGLHPQRPRGTVYAPLTDSWRLSDDVGVNYMMAAIRRAD
ncbi:MAG: bifunctional 2-polyprenyl-6-hydroxyphenol methylase/3-demethylubiquinol 3-O-methyltransferase UbiG [Pseudomonadota bacterium]